MTELRYRSFVEVDELAVGECTIKTCIAGTTRFWHMWGHVLRDSGEPLTFVVPINPNGDFNPQGPGGKTWGLKRSGLNRWQISPSINVLASSGEAYPGYHPERSLWHQTPALVNVPDLERWQLGGES